MRALIYDGTSPSLANNHPDPSPLPGDAVVRTLRAGVSRIDREICQGLFGFTGVLGQEFVGTVEAIEGGNGTPDLKGRRVVGSIGGFCGRCEMCQAGLSPHCRERTMLGMQGRDGCLAERFVLQAQNLVPVPDSVDDDHAVFARPLAAAIQAARQLTIEGKPYITVLGDGTMGLLMVQVMAKLNASVRILGRHAEKLAVCEKWGIKHRHIDDVGRRADQDVVVDCTGTTGGLELAMQLVRPRGKVVMKTLMAAGGNGAVDLAPLVLNEIHLIGSHYGPIAEAVSMIARQEVDVLSLISRRMGLDDGPALLTASAQPKAVKVIVNV